MHEPRVYLEADYQWNYFTPLQALPGKGHRKHYIIYEDTALEN